MTTLVNLLPWRSLRRRARLHFWLSLLITTSLLLSILAGWLYQMAALRSQQLNWLNQHQQVVNQALQQRLSAAQTRYQQQQQRQQALITLKARQQQISQWRFLLEQLARDLPDQAWISAIDYQQQQLRIEGYARTPAALQDSASALSQLENFTDPQLCDTSFDTDKWRFCLLLTRKIP